MGRQGLLVSIRHTGSGTFFSGALNGKCFKFNLDFKKKSHEQTNIQKINKNLRVS